MRTRMARATSIVSAVALVATVVEPADAGHRWHRPLDIRPEASFKLGVYDPKEGVGSGVFGGLELAGRPSEHFSLGVTGDYFYRGTESRTDAFIESDNPYDFPVETTVSEFVSSSHLAMLGVVGRLRFPTGRGGPTPFVQGGLLAQLLHLRASGRDVDGGLPGSGRSHRDDDVVSDTFTGLGWHVGAGVDQPLDGRVALTGELGYLYAEPTKTAQDWDDSVTYRALASGVYARAGLRVTY